MLHRRSSYHRASQVDRRGSRSKTSQPVFFSHLKGELTFTQVLVNVISGGLTPPITYHDAEQAGAKMISVLSPHHHLLHLLISISILPRVLRCDGPCGPRRYAIPEKDGDRLHLRAWDGPPVVLRGDGVGGSDGVGLPSRGNGLQRSLALHHPSLLFLLFFFLTWVFLGTTHVNKYWNNERETAS